MVITNFGCVWLVLLSLISLYQVQLTYAVTQVNFQELINEHTHTTRGPISLSFANSTTRTITLTPSLSFVFACFVSGATEHIPNAIPWTVNGNAVMERTTLAVPEASLVYYYQKAGHDRWLVFKNYNTSMNANYTCTTTTDTYSVVIIEGQLTVVFRFISQTQVHGLTGVFLQGIFLAGIPQPSPYTNLTWYFNGVELTNELATSLLFSYNWHPGGEMSFLQLSGFVREMEGTYRASVMTSGGSGYAEFYLNIESRTSICVPTEDGECVKEKEMTIPTNATFTINCTDFNGDPEPEFSWSKDSYSLTSANDSVTIFEPAHRFTSMTITNIQPEMAGVYSCFANNRVGRSNAEIIINVEFPPDISPITSLIHAVPIGQPIHLLVQYKGGFPPPTVEWYKLSTNSMEEDILLNTRASLSGLYGLNLTIYNSTINDGSLYVLYVNNSVGMAVKLTFNVSILVPPEVTRISQLVLYRSIGDCAIFLVNINGAKPPVISTDLYWTGNFITDSQTIISFNDDISNLTLCNLRTDNTGFVQLKVNHSSSDGLIAVFNLTVWNPPSAPSRLSSTGTPPQSCVLILSWSVNPPAVNYASIDTVIIEESHCRINSSCLSFNWNRIGIFPSSRNFTNLHLLPDQSYKFRATSVNNHIGYGRNVVSAHYISTEVKDYRPTVGSLSLIPLTFNSMNLTWTLPTVSTNCYNISTYNIQCNNTFSNTLVMNKSIHHSSITTNTAWTLITGLSSDSSYTCTVTILVNDITGNTTTLGLSPQMVVNYTAPLPPSRPSLPSLPTSNTRPNTIQLSLESFKATLSNRVSHVRIAVLRLGTSPTIPYENPDTIKDEDFSTYNEVHSQAPNRGLYPPYFAAEFTILQIPNEFLIGSEEISSRKRLQISNGPLNSSDHYASFLRVYSRSNFGRQYTIYNSSNFIGPVQPVRSLTSSTPRTTGGGGGGAAGAAVGVVIALLIILVIVGVVILVVVILYKKKKKQSSGDLRSPVRNEYTLTKLKNGDLSPENTPPTRSPPTISPPPPPLSATNPGYDKLELAQSIYDKPSLSPDPIHNQEGDLLSEDSNSSDCDSLRDFIPTTEEQGKIVMAKEVVMPIDLDFKTICQVKRELFQDHLKELDANRQEKFCEQFKSICDLSPNYPAVASQEEHNFVSGKNRYRDIVAFDHTRVRLQMRPTVPHSDYINANYIKGYHDNQLYIATQGPKEETHIDFWRMIWEQNTVTIVMLTNLIEKGKSKCYQYWPNEGQATYGQIVVRVDRNIVLPHYTIRGFKVFHTASLDKERTVLQFHYTAWPDRNVPSQASPLLDFLRAINSVNDSPDYGPMVVHCSAGVGRTGTIIALDIAIEQLKAEGQVDVQAIVSFLRKQRRQMIQTESQFIFIYHAILEDIIYGDSSILLGSFHDYFMKLNDCSLVHDEYNKIGSVKPPAQAYSEPNVVHQIIENKDEEKFVAHYIDGYWKPNLFIASPCPTSQNIERFWRMVWKEQCTHIINLSPKDTQTFSYLPPIGDLLQLDNMTVRAGKKEFNTGYISRTICITTEEGDSRQELIVNHIQYQEWQIKFLPRADKFSRFIQVCLMEVEKPDRGDHPILIHDDGSNGPVGVFATLSYCFQRAKKERLIDLLQAVNLHYLQCPGLIINLQYYAFCYDCLHEYTEKLLKEESVSHIYENIASFRGKLSPDLKNDENHQEAENLGYEILD